jgi:hypothetical protein
MLVGGARPEAEVVVGSWQPALTGATRDAAMEAALGVGSRLAYRAVLARAIASAGRQSHHPQAFRWETHQVAQGEAGLAIACAYLDRCLPGSGWDRVGHDFLASAATSAAGSRVLPGLFGGLSGLGFAAMLLGRGGARYGKLASAVEAELVPETHLLAQTVRSRLAGLPVREFDAISGLAGIGAYLLADRTSPARGAALKHTVEALVELVEGPGGERPRWVTPPEAIPDASVAALYPHGSLNCGLAHGIPGPLAVMSLALSAGAPVTGLRQAVEGSATWLVAHRRDDQWGVNWPTMVTLPESGAPVDEPSRAAWCYGAPGVARALWLAGTALADDSLRALAVDAMESVYRRPRRARNIDSPTFCHGVAGLLQITLRFAHDTRLPVFTRAATELAEQILDAYEPETSLLGFRSVEPEGNLVDNAGLLDGAPGVALVLLAAATTAEPTWDRLFLLS